MTDRDTLALLAHYLRDLSAEVGRLNALALRAIEDTDEELVREHTEANASLENLHAGIAAVANSFPPPGQNGGRR